MDTLLQEKRKKRIFILGLILYFAITIFLTYITNSEIVIFFIGTLPILFSLISLSVLIEMTYFNSWFFLGIPLIWGFAFFGIWYTKIIPLINKMNGPTMLTLNIFFTYIIFIIIALFWGKEKKQEQNTIVIDNTNKLNDQDKLKLLQEKEKIDYEKEHYKKLATDYFNYINNISKTLELKNHDIEYYKNIANAYYRHIESNKDEKEKYENLANSYSIEIQNYINHIKKQRDQILKNEKLQNDVTKYENLNSNLRREIIDLNQKLKDAENALNVTKDNFTSSLRSIEDKCKAINFVIGRVYSDRKGGSPASRDILKINRILYNAFSKITSNFDVKHIKVLMQILNLLQKKLGLLLLAENKLIKIKHIPNSNIKRNAHGHTPVIDVLIQNDDDPVKEYYAEANEICINMIKYLKQNYNIE